MHPCSPLLLIISKYLQIRKILSSIISFYSVCKKELFLVGLLSFLLFLTIQLYPSSSITNSIIPSQINLQIVNLSSGRIHLAPVSLVECTLNYSELFTRYGWEEERIWELLSLAPNIYKLPPKSVYNTKQIKIVGILFLFHQKILS